LDRTREPAQLFNPAHVCHEISILFTGQTDSRSQMMDRQTKSVALCGEIVLSPVRLLFRNVEILKYCRREGGEMPPPPLIVTYTLTFTHPHPFTHPHTHTSYTLTHTSTHTPHTPSHNPAYPYTS